MKKRLLSIAALLCVGACSSPNASGWEKTFADDPRIDIDSLSDMERCAFTDEEVKGNVASAPTGNLHIDWKEAGVRMSIPWNPLWGTKTYKTAPWRNDGVYAAFGPLRPATGSCKNLLVSAYGAEKNVQSLLDIQKDATFNNLKAYIVGTKKALRYEATSAAGTLKNLAVEVPGGTIIFYGETEADIAVFENIVRTMDTTTLGNL